MVCPEHFLLPCEIRSTPRPGLTLPSDQPANQGWLADTPSIDLRAQLFPLQTYHSCRGVPCVELAVGRAQRFPC